MFDHWFLSVGLLVRGAASQLQDWHAAQEHFSECLGHLEHCEDCAGGFSPSCAAGVPFWIVDVRVTWTIRLPC